MSRLFTAIEYELGLDLRYFDAEQTFVQSKLSEDFYMHLAKGCGAMSRKVVKLCRSLYGLKHVSRQWHHHFVRGIKGLAFEQCDADACGMHLVEAGGVSIVVVVHADGIFGVELMSRCDQFCEDLNQFVPINNLGKLRWNAGCRLSRDWDAGTMTISQQVFAEATAVKSGVTRDKSMPAVVDVEVRRFNEDEPDVDELFRW